MRSVFLFLVICVVMPLMLILGLAIGKQKKQINPLEIIFQYQQQMMNNSSKYNASRDKAIKDSRTKEEDGNVLKDNHNISIPEYNEKMENYSHHPKEVPYQENNKDINYNNQNNYQRVIENNDRIQDKGYTKEFSNENTVHEVYRDGNIQEYREIKENNNTENTQLEEFKDNKENKVNVPINTDIKDDSIYLNGDVNKNHRTRYELMTDS